MTTHSQPLNGSLPRPLNEVKANLFKGLAHPVRIRVLEILAENTELPVSELLEQTGLAAPHLSQHLSVLRRYNLVVGDRRGLQMFYSLAYPEVAELLAVSKKLLQRALTDTREQLEAHL